jgi:hypothetical protein
MFRRLAIYGAVALSLWGAWEAGTRFTAPGKIDPDLRSTEATSDRVNIIVELGFAPEAVHIRMFQRIGAVVGIDHIGNNTNVRIVGVSSGDVDRLARRYWIRRIALLHRASKD